MIFLKCLLSHLSPILCVVSVVMISATNVQADIDAREFSDPQKRQTYLDLTRELRCPKCQNQDIADSNAPIAQDMRQHVQSLVEDGKSHSEVVDFMIERFGEFVTYKPRVKPATYLLWYGPWLLVILGFFIILTRVRTTPRPLASEDENKEPDPQEQTDMQKINALLSKYETLDDQPDPYLPQTNKDP